MTWLTAVIMAALFVLAPFVYLSWYFGWEWRTTSGVAYFGKSPAGRDEIKQRIRRYSRPLAPVLKVLAVTMRRKAVMAAFEYEGVYGPTKVSSPAVFAKARAYSPQPEDVFVSTQMRCGTTWMQQAVWEIVTRARVNPADRQHLYATSPWIDAVNSVSMDNAPLVGEPPARIIKTHLPVELCPYSRQAKYIYVARHPVSCFASIMDFNRSMVGPFVPPVEAMADWFCSDRMYWLPWPRHVEGWWRWSLERPNVLFVHFEDMTRDFGAVLDRVARFLERDLTAGERDRVIERCSFRFMKAHEDLFEMAPPTMFSVAGGQFMASGKEKRHEDVTPEIRDRIVAYCRKALRGAAYPARDFYPDLAPTAGQLEQG